MKAQQAGGRSLNAALPPRRLQRPPDPLHVEVSLDSTLQRLPVPVGTPQHNATVQTVVRDGFLEALTQYEQHLQTLHTDSRPDAIERAYQALREIEDRLLKYSGLLGNTLVALEDHIAYAGKLLRDQTAPRPADGADRHSNSCSG